MRFPAPRERVMAEVKRRRLERQFRPDSLPMLVRGRVVQYIFPPQ